MTSANGLPAALRRCHPAASRSADARGALPPGPEARAAPAGRGRAVARAIKATARLAAAVLAIAGSTASPGYAQLLPPAPTQTAALGPAAGLMSDVGRGTGVPSTWSSSPRVACLAAVREAEAVHGLPEGLLVAVALSESGLHAHALNIGGRAHYPEDPDVARAMLRRAGGRSVMAGCLQVNAGVHARGSDWPLDPVRSADWAANHLRRWYLGTGSWTEALKRWHGGSPAGTRRLICRVRAKLEVTAPGSDVLTGAGCAGRDMVRVRRSGAALLEVAEAPMK
jgi:hypothetical protein